MEGGSRAPRKGVSERGVGRVAVQFAWEWAVDICLASLGRLPEKMMFFAFTIAPGFIPSAISSGVAMSSGAGAMFQDVVYVYRFWHHFACSVRLVISPLP